VYRTLDCFLKRVPFIYNAYFVFLLRTSVFNPPSSPLLAKMIS